MGHEPTAFLGGTEIPVIVARAPGGALYLPAGLPVVIQPATDGDSSEAASLARLPDFLAELAAGGGRNPHFCLA